MTLLRERRGRRRDQRRPLSSVVVGVGDGGGRWTRLLRRRKQKDST